MKANSKNPDKLEHWGILGGAFDPVHLGHTNLANQLCEKLDLDGVLFVIANSHPFKSSSISESYKNRLTMLTLALEGFPKFTISEIEKEEKLNGSTLATVEALKKEFPDTRFTFLIGTDNISQFDYWHHPEKIVETIEIAVGTRPRYKINKQDSKFKDKMKMVEIKELDISSTLIKEYLAHKKYIKLNNLLDDRVIEYIKENGLYQNG